MGRVDTGFYKKLWELFLLCQNIKYLKLLYQLMSNMGFYYGRFLSAYICLPEV